VARRTHEIGIHMALGARPGGVLAQVVCRALALAANLRTAELTPP